VLNRRRRWRDDPEHSADLTRKTLQIQVRRRRQFDSGHAAGNRPQAVLQRDLAFGVRSGQKNKIGHSLVDSFNSDRVGVGANELALLHLAGKSSESGALASSWIDGKD
jgi:hypothetical protein